MADLEPIEPSKAVDLYLRGRDDISENTRESQLYDLRAFVAWTDEVGLTNMNELSGRDLYEFRVWRRDGGYSGEEIETVTLRGTLATVRAFLRFCVTIDAVEDELWDKLPLPVAGRDEQVSDSTLDPDRAVAILEHLDKYKYASRQHVILLLLWHTGCRSGAIRGLDLGDLDLDGTRARGEGPAVHFVHRPDTGTPLKNKGPGTRWNAISQEVATVLRDYIDGPRKEATDEHGRRPLLSTSQGRISSSSIRSTLYRVTRPCWRGEACPHDEDPDTCEFTESGHMSRCPSARSPHDVRSGRVTAYRRANVKRDLVEDRLNASDDVLDKHYDRRSEREKAAQRRRYFDI
ncbi:site-specific integrase [Halorubrum sp. SP3]|uniref:tyrosine-type recombinase/integrase n=1 Tax=Halorubrum sp. SP3 TaxID=1537265 RepID=UPI0010FA4DB8|nr:site-specific integrase [Halorubrum sp. SP3]TKX54503.1 site-specific integrase [Halorubrum sp. SP3]